MVAKKWPRAYKPYTLGKSAFTLDEITLPAGIALAFGANIGTCVTAVLASLGKPVEAVRAAAVHITFNVAGVLLWVMFIPQLADFVAAISPSSPGLSGKARIAAEVPRQIANAHTVFNVANTLSGQRKGQTEMRHRTETG